ncbi:ribosome silencing factor [Pseudoalteromonas citrea]|uniref:Ribosomal silencing factor RsfS n=3 Tax=Pseudoalteromonas TaxID=53246 RepID=A0A5S3VDX5_9GAMM|nr:MULTISPECIES: ribosome silencing factor [Pseudoalteromonas]KAF7774327.1 ribosome-associated protein [Pseudoalteromonas citrea]RJE73754.1 ribosome silencing factor [Pseudoalteromonas sp. MSK9-3]TMO64497.1 ribosome silencing factor [Pseudoalteromonas aurantia]TMO70429.1 ribosome silencing factor [Pseudoalteromonas aurantia]TMO77704.1 ribosome silencing factor [Pseudoalteromonas aurantia]
MNSEQLLDFALDKVDDMKARDVVKLDVRDVSTVTDYLVVCSGNSKRHVQSIADNVAKAARHAGEEPLGQEGQDVGEWVLVDLGDVVVHVMQDQTRSLYDLEKLWG